MATRFGHIELFCADAKASRDWYIASLGAKPISDQGEFQWVEIGGAELLLRPGTANMTHTYRDASMAVVFYVDYAAALKEGLENLGIEVTHGDSDECLTFQDPDGHWIQAVQKS